MDFAVPADDRLKLKESKKKDKYLDLAWELQNNYGAWRWDAYCNWCTWNNPLRIDKRSRRLKNRRTNREHPDNGIIKIGQNTEKSPGVKNSQKSKW